MHLLVKVEKRFCGIWEGFAKVITFYHVTCSNFSGFVLQGVDGNRHQSSVFYLTASLICGGCLLVNYQKSIFSCGNPNSCQEIAIYELEKLTCRKIPHNRAIVPFVAIFLLAICMFL